jgi:hypothetical protein
MCDLGALCLGLVLAGAREGVDIAVRWWLCSGRVRRRKLTLLSVFGALTCHDSGSTFGCSIAEHESYQEVNRNNNNPVPGRLDVHVEG